MGMVEERLSELGIELAPPKQPVANYLGCKLSGELLYVAARVSTQRGEVGTDLDRDAAERAARDTIVLLLSIIRARDRESRSCRIR
ncbi:MAG: hypothetical protein DHS20C14_01900 [Phycisphaeraceae bacterium]|nr:MAG: hypothetical protein DHS20C14_01900 [Phycisphaeraceae bacterium]